MKIKYLLSIIAIVAITKDSFAQYSQDAIRFSTFQTGSTSRIKAIGNAGTAVGGDLSSVSGNPAGLGFFTHSEVSITPEYDNSKISSSFFGQAGSANRNDVNMSNAAIVFYQQLTTRGRDKSKGWLSINYGAGYSRTNNFYENVAYGGTNQTSSISDYYAGIAKREVSQYGSVNPNGLDGWAYDHVLIDNFGPATDPNSYASTVNVPVRQLAGITRTGGQSEFNLSFGANYSNKLYLGLGLAITDIRYNSHARFTENGNAIITNGGNPTDFSSTFAQDQSTKGSGFNAKLGIIYKPIQALRLGFTFTSPTFYNIDDSYAEGLATQYTGGKSYQNVSEPYQLSYNLRTPLKLAGGASVFIGKYGFISGDVEYIDYTTTHLSTNDSYTADGDNSDIKSLYRSTVNLHVGAEVNVNSLVYLRGGYSQQGNPMKDLGSDIKTVSGGIGFHFGAYFVDATYARVTGKQTIFPYEVGATSPFVDLKKTNNNAFLTLGYRF
ncbi:hypothetical protein J3L18_29200 [Mucilaginibacter gossypii]|uniref:OmpP1/FadL family transporter n=1 Tax=Mucilaginibacter gossypii TaxID=551996 RepID=UPI000DCF43AF|nr:MULTISPECIES: hypothetical protein [Mucilaginibacter]QTE37139.1 hypothetical protein J3L18_29200 [Mucilaginibacter gossypii]RAV59118.1 hypothetical protein DIU36_07785 [Mucilaginibacter rubeus]